jgi:hypothetical protein
MRHEIGDIMEEKGWKPFIVYGRVPYILEKKTLQGWAGDPDTKRTCQTGVTYCRRVLGTPELTNPYAKFLVYMTCTELTPHEEAELFSFFNLISGLRPDITAIASWISGYTQSLSWDTLQRELGMRRRGRPFDPGSLHIRLDFQESGRLQFVLIIDEEPGVGSIQLETKGAIPLLGDKHLNYPLIEYETLSDQLRSLLKHD